MMKKLLSMLLALMLLCGCVAFAEAATYAGMWTLIGAEMGGAPIDLSLIGLTMTMDLREDGTCTLTTMDMAEEGTWTETEGVVAVADAAGDVQNFVLADDKLEASQDNMKIIFARMGDAATFVGVWELTGLVADGVEMGVETMAMFGLTMTVTLNEDGTCVLDAAGEVDDGTWTVTDNGVSVDDGIEVVELLYVDDMLVVEEDGGMMMLTRQGAAPAVVETAAGTALLTGVPAEAFEGEWELATAVVFGMELTAADMGAYINLELAEGKGIYIEGEAEGEALQAEITYTVTETEGEATLLTLLYQDATLEEPVELMALNMLEDGRLCCQMNVEGMDVSYYFVPVVEEIPAE